jgi:CRP-like cAMP-binding protein
VTTEVQTRRDALRSVDAFRTIPDGGLNVLAEMLQTERFVAGEVVCRRGEPSDAVYVVAEGRLVVQVQDGVTAREIGPGSIVGEYGMFGERVRSSTLIAADDAVLFALEYRRFVPFLRAYPDALLSLLETAVARLLELEASVRDRSSDR